MMSEERKGQIALAATKARLRKEFSFRDIANLKRNIGNSVKEPELKEINATAEEILELSRELLQEIFNKQLKTI